MKKYYARFLLWWFKTNHTILWWIYLICVCLWSLAGVAAAVIGFWYGINAGWAALGAIVMALICYIGCIKHNIYLEKPKVYRTIREYFYEKTLERRFGRFGRRDEEPARKE